MIKRVIVGIVFVVLALCTAHAANIYVPDDYIIIQDAIDAAVDGDVVIVRPGYRYQRDINFRGKAITVKSEKGPAVTILDGNSQKYSIVIFDSGEGPDSILEGFTLRNGQGTEIGVETYGGGICCVDSSPTIRNNIIKRNCATYGGAVYCINSEIVVANNTVSDNNAGLGGGAYCWSSSPTFVGNCILNNDGFDGGGMRCEGGNYTIVNNIIANNISGLGNGGGIDCSAPKSVSGTTFILANNTIASNQADNYGGGICCGGQSLVQVTVTNSIIVDNYSWAGENISVLDNAALTIDHSNVISSGGSIYVSPGGTFSWGTGMIEANPLFVEPQAGDFHLTWSSPCRNSGDNNAPGVFSADFEGDPRIKYSTVDMGADEFHPHLYYTGSVILGGTISIRMIGEPGTNPVTLGMGSGIQDPPLATPYGDLYLLPPLLFQDLGAVPPAGIRAVHATVPTWWWHGEQYPFQALIGPLGNPGSVLTNLLVLDVE